MRNVEKKYITSFILVLLLVGCSPQVHHVAEEEKPQKVHDLPEMQLKDQENDPQLKTWAISDDHAKPTEGTPESLQREVQQMEQAWLESQLTIQSRVYLTKGGELFGDFTLNNHYPFPVKNVTVECVEFDMNNHPLRTSSSTLLKTIVKGDTVYWEEVNFGYVHDGFHSVQCGIPPIPKSYGHS